MLGVFVTIFQQRSSVSNLFQTGMKVEVKGPKYDSGYRIATVVNVIGPRLQLRFDGCSNCDDMWVLYDSCEIRPLGWCKENGFTLKQPEGFCIVFLRLSALLLRALNL